MNGSGPEKRKILLLGGSAQQVVAIETAKRLGLYTVLCDYLPDNPGQYHADKFYLVSTTDKDAVLEVAQKECVEGILAYASDPAAPTAAYVAEIMDLPTNPFKSVETLCNKDLFRRFLKENGFNTPRANGYSDLSELQDDINNFNFPIIIKPTDSSGSKGVTVLKDPAQLEKAAEFALKYSRGHRIIAEEYIEKKHPYLIGGDIFVLDGEVVQWGLMNCHRDQRVNPLVPVGKSYPPILDETDINSVKETIREIVKSLDIRFGPMNVELIVDAQERVFPIDIGPRSGGNMIPDLLGMIFKCDVVEMTIKAAMGENAACEKGQPELFYATLNLHSDKDGIYEGISLSEQIKRYIIRKDIYKKKGDVIRRFSNASDAIGIVFFKFPDLDTMLTMENDIARHVTIELENDNADGEPVLCDNGTVRKSGDCYAAGTIREVTELDGIAFVLKKLGGRLASVESGRVDVEKLADKYFRNGTVLEMMHGDKCVGFTAFYHNDAESGKGYISTIAVSPEYEGAGFGTALLTAAERMCSAQGMRSVALKVRSDNDRAIEFYRKNGYSEKMTDNKEILMQKRLKKGKENQHEQ